MSTPNSPFQPSTFSKAEYGPTPETGAGAFLPFFFSILRGPPEMGAPLTGAPETATGRRRVKVVISGRVTSGRAARVFWPMTTSGAKRPGLR